MKRKLLLGFCIVTLAISACKKDKTDIPPRLNGFAQSNSVIIVDEGLFFGNNGSFTFVDSAGNVSQNVFEAANGGLPPGDVVQHYTRSGDKGIITVNNSQKVIIVNAETMETLHTFTDNFDYPRYALGVNDKVYITNGSGSGTVVVLNLESMTEVKTIAVGRGPEMLATSGDFLYVCNSGGFSNDDSTVSVISTLSDMEVKKIHVGDVPVDIAKDAAGNLWVLCKGVPDYSNFPFVKKLSPAKLVRIDAATQTVTQSFTLLNIGSEDDVFRLAIGNSGNTIYYNTNEGIFAINIAALILPASPIIPGSFYGLDVNPRNQDIWGLDAKGFVTQGYAYRYSIGGAKIDSVRTGIGPNNVYFN